jgi:hypothetical protein
MNGKIAWLLVLLVSIAAVLAGVAYCHARTQLHESQVRELAMLSSLLEEDQDLLGKLHASNSNILASYLTAIRADGVAKHADAKQELDRLAENNAALLTLINVYKPNAKTAVFNAEAGNFQRYAIAWRDRWTSVMELFMAGGNYPVVEVSFPEGFVGAVRVEIQATQ